MENKPSNKTGEGLVVTDAAQAATGSVDVKSLRGLGMSVGDVLLPYLRNYDSFSKTMAATKELVPLMAVDLKPLGKAILDHVAEIQTSFMATVGTTLNQVWPELSRFVQNIVLPQVGAIRDWAETSSSLSDSLGAVWDLLGDKYNVSERAAIAILRKYNWFVTPNMPVEFVYEVVKLGRRQGNKRKELNSLFVDYFLGDNNKELDECIKSWRSSALIGKRHKIMRDCSYLLKQRGRGFNPCNFVLPVLISQIDSMKHGLLVNNGLSPYYTKWMDGNGKQVKWKEHLKSVVVVDEMDDLAGDLLLTVLFQEAYPGVSLKSAASFNRHKIMHGESLHHGRVDNTIRAVMLIDFLVAASS